MFQGAVESPRARKWARFDREVGSLFFCKTWRDQQGHHVVSGQRPRFSRGRDAGGKVPLSAVGTVDRVAGQGSHWQACDRRWREMELANSAASRSACCQCKRCSATVAWPVRVLCVDRWQTGLWAADQRKRVWPWRSRNRSCRRRRTVRAARSASELEELRTGGFGLWG
jgi:hypothetical protein